MSAEARNTLADELRPRGLGRGLSALIGEEAVPTRGEARGRAHCARVPIAFLQTEPLPAAQTFAEEDARTTLFSR